MSALDTLKALLPVFGPSGRESQVADALEAMVKPFADEIRRDAMGNLIVLKRGGGRKVLLAAHMDQIGLMVTHIDREGFVRVTPVGGVRQHWNLFLPVCFANGTRGVMGYETKTVDNMEKLKPEHLFVDIGARTREEAEARVQVGDMAVFLCQPSECGSRFSCGALDDRAGCAILVEVLKRMKKSPYDVYAVFTTQEEVGTRGAVTAGYALQPELCVALDVTLSPDTPEAQPICSARLGRGPAVKVRDASLIAHPRVRRWLEDAAKAAGIPYQLEVLTAGGTDAGAVQPTREGVPSGVISIPTRYVHSAAEMIDLTDFNQCIDLLVKALETEA